MVKDRRLRTKREDYYRDLLDFRRAVKSEGGRNTLPRKRWRENTIVEALGWDLQKQQFFHCTCTLAFRCSWGCLLG